MVCDIQKANFWKRISAALLDLMLFLVLAVGVMSLMSPILGFNKRVDRYYEIRDNHVEECEAKYEEEHGERVELDLSIAYGEMSDAQKEIYDEVEQLCNNDAEMSYIVVLLLNYSLIITIVSTLIPHIILEFVVPMILKNGQTVGKKVFALGVVRTNSVKVSPTVAFIRMLLGKFTIETIVPIFIILMIFFGVIGLVGPIVLLALLILEIVMMCITHTNSTIHDLISDTVVVDMSTQLVFENEQALIDYKKKLHEEEVARAPY